MIDRLKEDLVQFLRQHPVAHLALSGPDGPWASVVRFMSAGLTLYLIEPRVSDLVFYVENDAHVVLTIDDPGTDREGNQWESIQIFGTARILAPHELHERPVDVQTAYSLKDRPAPGVYVVIEVKPIRVHRVVHDDRGVHRDTVDIEPVSNTEE